MKFEFLVKIEAINVGKVKGIFGNSLIGRKNSNVQKFWKFSKIDENPIPKFRIFKKNPKISRNIEKYSKFC